ncbi:hypothetical protein NDU88_006063 [Pleurodeles waltl]|uniref:Uncharacterized protein n=1 Tax=Pleurodeles waltl TaxID=8319 RepID=A0AAV7NP98_PLEWA|nr:hypothetical protein NDU88_006063 [Pleurodeles waltl]
MPESNKPVGNQGLRWGIRRSQRAAVLRPQCNGENLSAGVPALRRDRTTHQQSDEVPNQAFTWMLPREVPFCGQIQARGAWWECASSIAASCRAHNCGTPQGSEPDKPTSGAPPLIRWPNLPSPELEKSRLVSWANQARGTNALNLPVLRGRSMAQEHAVPALIWLWPHHNFRTSRPPAAVCFPPSPTGTVLKGHE